MTGQVICGGDGSAAAVTVTVELHDPLVPSESVAVQLNAVVPTGNDDPEGGAQLVVMGLTPPLTVRPVYDTLTGLPSGDVAVSTGHVIETGDVSTPENTSFDAALSVPEAS